MVAAVLLAAFGVLMIQACSATRDLGPRNSERQPPGSTAQRSRSSATTGTAATNVVLGRPTAESIVLSVLTADDTKASIEYGSGPTDLASRKERLSFTAGQPKEVTLDGLASNARCFYRLVDASSDRAIVEGSFYTQRTPGSTFTFTVTADPHLDGNTDPVLYQRTLANAASDSPDFHIDLGDTFMTDKQQDRGSAGKQYLAQRSYFGQVCGSIPLYLTLGNHDGESGKSLRAGADSGAVWSNTMRKTYFPNPSPDGFYTGNTAEGQYDGALEDYYAWTWGDALFIVLDPYWYATKPSDDGWGLTLGSQQYSWLKKTLETSDAKYKFVFVHQLVGGSDRAGRGGTRAASFTEWGGNNADGSAGFAEHRPGWSMPIHDLLVANRVTAVFHGHDHLYAKEDLDGIVYQEVPQPGFPGLGDPRSAAEYGYTEGVILGSSGHLRVTVSPEQVKTEYVRAYLPKDENAERVNGQVGHSYNITATD